MRLKDICDKPLIPKFMNNEESKRVAARLNRYYEADLALARLGIELKKCHTQ